MTDSFAALDATAQADLVRNGEATPAELVEAAVQRAERLNPELNAIIHEFYDEAVAEANGDLPDGPFKGVPFVFKDLGAGYAGQPMHLGNQALKDADFRLPMDTFLAQRFRAAGFVVIGKTNTPEFGILPTTEPRAYGASRNPWDPSRSTGGSSGGSGAAAAAGIVPVAHANDGGGSIRIPASANGLVGLKPTRARTSQGPLIGDSMSGLTEELVVSHSVRDTAAILDAVHGMGPGDPYTAPAPARPYVEELGSDPGRLKIGFSSTPAAEVDVHPECVAALEAATKLLESLGHELVPASPVEMAVAVGGDEGVDIFDSFLTRWSAGQAQLAEQLSLIVGRELTADDFEPLTWTLIEIGRARSAPRYLLDVGMHQGLSRMVAGWFESGFDLLVTPTMAEPPVPLGTHDDSGPDPMDAFHRARSQGAFTALGNITGAPGISLPMHWTPEGLPVGIHLASKFGREDVLIAVASQLEAAQPWADRRPALFAA